MSEFYHLIFEDWDASIERQGRLIAALLPSPKTLGPVLDCACGIGTQLIALKKLGYFIEGSDLSPQAVSRALKEVAKRNLTADIRVDDMLVLQTALPDHYGAILAMDNAIPHLSSDEEIVQALLAMKACLKSEGALLLSIRDYESILSARPKVTDPVFFQDESGRRIVHQVWDWIDQRNYFAHIYVTCQNAQDWDIKHSFGKYRAITTNELECLMIKAGFVKTSILSSTETGFYQPILRGMTL